MSAHTPESWWVLDNRENPYAKGQVHVIAGGGLTVATITYQAPDANGETERMANARLISVSPELLQAVLDARALLTDERFGTWQYMESEAFYSDGAKVRKTLQAVIAKALGSQS